MFKEHTFTASALTYKSQSLTFVNLKIKTVNRLNHLGFLQKPAADSELRNEDVNDTHATD